jgi:hypothetical protein
MFPVFREHTADMIVSRSSSPADSIGQMMQHAARKDTRSPEEIQTIVRMVAAA